MLEDRTIESGIPVTTVERTLLDIAGGLDGQQLERALVAADRSHRLRWPELERVIAEGSGRPGIGRLRKVAEAVDPRAAETRSALEVDFLGLCRYFDISLPQVNVLVAGNLVDFLWRDRRFVVETDGYLYHRGEAAFQDDHSRDLELMRLGYEVLRLSERQLEAESRRVAEVLAARLDRPPRGLVAAVPARQTLPA